MTGASLLAFARSRLGMGLIGALALALLAWAAISWFDGQLDQARREGRAAADTEWRVAISAANEAARQWKTAYEFKAAEVATYRRSAHEKALARNAAAADDLRLHGPGRAAAGDCKSIDRAGYGTATGGPAATAARPHDPASPLPPADGPDQFAIVPWIWLTGRARDFDDLRDEVITWRTWYPEQADLLRKAKLELPEPKLGAKP